MDQAMKHLAMCPLGEQVAGFAELQRLYFHVADEEFAAKEGIELNTPRDDIAPGILTGKCEAVGAAEFLDFLELDECHVFGRGRAHLPGEIAVAVQSLSGHRLDLVDGVHRSAFLFREQNFLYNSVCRHAGSWHFAGK